MRSWFLMRSFWFCSNSCCTRNAAPENFLVVIMLKKWIIFVESFRVRKEMILAFWQVYPKSSRFLKLWECSELWIYSWLANCKALPFPGIWFSQDLRVFMSLKPLSTSCYTFLEEILSLPPDSGYVMGHLSSVTKSICNAGGPWGGAALAGCDESVQYAAVLPRPQWQNGYALIFINFSTFSVGPTYSSIISSVQQFCS